mmetsp:Transcript_67233/g.194419  ORF Transcript_67233/g.194419 Transcript_67233/m.194419 type:complete len:129 (-) Transcript_67233:1386-1772(-)
MILYHLPLKSVCLNRKLFRNTVLPVFCLAEERIAMSSATAPLHACEVKVSFPTNLQAEQALRILQVDAEPTNRVSKSFRLDHCDGKVAMVVRIESKELKMLRVAVSSFYDYLAVVMKTMQEFDTTLDS